MDMRRARVLGVAAVLAASAMTAAPASATVTLADVTIPASDGVSLVGDVHLPGDG